MFVRHKRRFMYHMTPQVQTAFTLGVLTSACQHSKLYVVAMLVHQVLQRRLC